MPRFFRRASAARSGRSAAYTIDHIGAEWFQGSPADLDADLATWVRGVRRYFEGSNGDVAEHRRAGFEMAQGLRHHLASDTFLPPPTESDAPKDYWLTRTTYEVGMSSVIYRDQHTFNDDDEKLLRLSLAVMGRYGYQPAWLGGNGELNDAFDSQAFHLMGNDVVARDDPSATLTDFFANFSTPAIFVGNGRPS